MRNLMTSADSNNEKCRGENKHLEEKTIELDALLARLDEANGPDMLVNDDLHTPSISKVHISSEEPERVTTIFKPFSELVANAEKLAQTSSSADLAAKLQMLLQTKKDYFLRRNDAVELSIALNLTEYIAPRFRALPPSVKTTLDDMPNQLSIDRQLIDIHWAWISGHRKKVRSEVYEDLFINEEFDWSLAEKFALEKWRTDAKIAALLLNRNLQWGLAQYQSKSHRDTWQKLQQGAFKDGKCHVLGIDQVTERLECSVTKQKHLAMHVTLWVNVWLASRISDHSDMGLAQIMKLITGEMSEEKQLKKSLTSILKRLDSYKRR